MPTETRPIAQARQVLAPRAILGGALVYLAIALVVAYAVDVHDALGLRTRMLSLEMNNPGLWYHIFGSRKVTEVLQWVLLALAASGAGVLGGRLSGRGDHGPGAFWSLVSIGAALMLVEDAGNVRDILAGYLIDAYPQFADLAALGFRLLIFGAIAAVLLWALASHGTSIWAVAHSRRYIVIAYAALAVGAVSDVSAVVGAYEAAGLFVHNTVAQGQLALFPGHTLATQAGMFMDSVWEEALELVGYASFLAAVTAYWRVEIGE